MTTRNFMALTPRQRHVMVMAMLVRNSIEQFHVDHLTQEQMKELNQQIRYGIYDAIELFETVATSPEREDFYALQVSAIPDYWEIPGRDPRPGTPRS